MTSNAEKRSASQDSLSSAKRVAPPERNPSRFTSRAEADAYIDEQMQKVREAAARENESHAQRALEAGWAKGHEEGRQIGSGEGYQRGFEEAKVRAHLELEPVLHDHAAKATAAAKAETMALYEGKIKEANDRAEEAERRSSESAGQANRATQQAEANALTAIAHASQVAGQAAAAEQSLAAIMATNQNMGQELTQLKSTNQALRTEVQTMGHKHERDLSEVAASAKARAEEALRQIEGFKVDAREARHEAEMERKGRKEDQAHYHESIQLLIKKHEDGREEEQKNRKRTKKSFAWR